jgi:hypothetical protein
MGAVRTISASRRDSGSATLAAEGRAGVGGLGPPGRGAAGPSSDGGGRRHGSTALFGLGLNWGRPGGGEDLPNQWILETFYKYQASATSAITLDIQQILHPALNPKQNIIGICSLRLRLVF